MGFFFTASGDHRDVLVLTRSFPTRRSPDLIGIWLQHGRLLFDRQLAVQLQHIDAARDVAARERGVGARDLALAGQEYQHVAEMLGERSAENTSELQSLMRISYAVF